jgi:hypothetical protein
VSTFLLDTSSVSTVSSVVLDPVASGTCPPIGLLAPCIGLNFADGTEQAFRGFPVYTSVGTFSQVDGDATITISAVPEPSSTLLLIAALGALVVPRIRPRRSAGDVRPHSGLGNRQSRRPSERLSGLWKPLRSH